ncbi:MAG: GNAT family N-acetyltransferase [Rickettsiales bacterium]|nr:GNAT family N-acetyltransferase [Pseudomonadota bacterium]MDA0965706.1 GNAT family N-acetyltransferase [Pseudomonadota bacterium]MDG4543832.1 GNAT family N-acetyltransferase [Rickettsiales bacterium]MDG4545979.1 GNAT family N-acetyltransferase [Rickettsiales bacterium]MDG4548225.1 GNAT family N-acetyltransferase [Rickettsiales bacterium]
MADAIKKDANIILIEKISEFKNTDLEDICDATESTIIDNKGSFNIGLKRSEPPVRERLEQYWKGVLLVPQRELFVGRLDGTISSSIQLIKPGPNNQTSGFTCWVDQHFVAPWAREHGLAKSLLKAAEKEAKALGHTVMRLRVNATLQSAVHMYESCGFVRWGTLDKFEIIDGKMTAGHYYYKDIK